MNSNAGFIFLMVRSSTNRTDIRLRRYSRINLVEFEFNCHLSFEEVDVAVEHGGVE